MDTVVPWLRLITLIEPHYPKAGRGRRPIALETMLRIHFMQHWFAFSDPVKGSRHEKLAPWQHEINHRLSRLRASVGHPFRVVKRQFGFTKVRYRGLGKNTAQLTTLLALSNLYLVRRQLLWVSVDKRAR